MVYNVIKNHPLFCLHAADNAAYFGVFSNPAGASSVPPQRALDDLGAVARMVREATGVKVGQAIETHMPHVLLFSI